MNLTPLEKVLRETYAPALRDQMLQTQPILKHFPPKPLTRWQRIKRAVRRRIGASR